MQVSAFSKAFRGRSDAPAKTTNVLCKIHDHSGRRNIWSTWLEPMTGAHDVTTCADIVYGKHFRTQISLVSAKNDFSGARARTRVTRERYTLS